MAISLLDGEDSEDTDRPPLVVRVSGSQKIDYRGEHDWRYWGLFYDDATREYYVATTQDQPIGSACIVAYFAGGKFSALDKGQGFVRRHAERVAAGKQQQSLKRRK